MTNETKDLKLSFTEGKKEMEELIRYLLLMELDTWADEDLLGGERGARPTVHIKVDGAIYGFHAYEFDSIEEMVQAIEELPVFRPYPFGLRLEE